MTRTVLFVGLALVLGSTVGTSQTPAPGPHAVLSPDALQWGPPPPGLPAGGQVAVLAGDPGKAGEMFALRVKMPAGYKVQPHWHPGDEHITILQGALMVGMGETVDKSKMSTMSVGSYAVMPKEMPHYVEARGATVLQITGIGPFGITYVKASDDPRKPTSN